MIFDGKDFYILIPKKIKVKDKEERHKVVALDPGKRVFQTGFSDTEFFESYLLLFISSYFIINIFMLLDIQRK